MTFRYSLFFLSVVLFRIIFSSNICLADNQRRFHSEVNGYSITIPDGWIEIPDEIVAEAFNQIFSAKSKSKFVYEMAFQQSKSTQLFQYPYVIIQVMTYSDIGLNRQINESEVKEFVNNLTGLEVNDVKEKYLSADTKRLLSGGALGKVLLDQENKIFIAGMEMDVDNVGGVSGQTVGHFGRYSIVQVMFYDLKSNWSQSTADRELI